MLLALFAANYLRVGDVAAATVPHLAAILKGESPADFDFAKLASDVLEVAKNIEAAGGNVPTTFDELVDCGISDTVAHLLMQQVFGSTEIIIGLDTRKVVCALDLIDWEGLEGVTLRSEIKMNLVTSTHVDRSIHTWLPRGQSLEFQQAMESLGFIIGANKKGFWGRLQAVITKNFKGKDKIKVEAMVNDILRFYKVVKCSERKKYRF